MAIEIIDMGSQNRIDDAKLYIDHISKRYGDQVNGVQALDPVAMAVREGDFVCVVGPSGCGKSTLLNLVAGFESPTSGSAILDGKTITGPSAERGVVFQQGALFNWLSVLENVSFGPKALGKSTVEATRTAQHYLEMVGLGDFMHRYPYELSGGMQQRVAIARALANEPEILLMDEPFAALDHQTRELLQEEIHSLWQKNAKTILWITHSIDEALFLATHIVVMSARPGRIKTAFRSDFALETDPMVTTTSDFIDAKRQIVTLLRTESIEAQRQETLA